MVIRTNTYISILATKYLLRKLTAMMQYDF